VLQGNLCNGGDGHRNGSNGGETTATMGMVYGRNVANGGNGYHGRCSIDGEGDRYDDGNG
jgi:hypothetical protein